MPLHAQRQTDTFFGGHRYECLSVVCNGILRFTSGATPGWPLQTDRQTDRLTFRRFPHCLSPRNSTLLRFPTQTDRQTDLPLAQTDRQTEKQTDLPLAASLIVCFLVARPFFAFRLRRLLGHFSLCKIQRGYQWVCAWQKNCAFKPERGCLMAHSHRAKAKFFFHVCLLFFDLVSLWRPIFLGVNRP